LAKTHTGENNNNNKSDTHEGILKDYSEKQGRTREKGPRQTYQHSVLRKKADFVGVFLIKKKKAF